jgi:cytidylate kinase
MSVITISRQYGSGGDEIAALVCQSTGYKLFDKQVLARAAYDAGLSEVEMVDYCEDNYKVKSLFERLFGGTQPVAQVRVWKESVYGLRTVEEILLDEEHALQCVQKAVQTAYELGDYVIVGRGGQVILKDHPEVLHVRLVAPLEERLLRVRQSPAITGQTYSDSVEARRAAQKMIEENDAASADYLKRFYGVDWGDPFLYHLVLNTSKLKPPQAAEAIVALARPQGF